ncbi:DEAD/DEAH box helicase [Fervidibacter sacchari]|uniref:Superfamily II RNA helicase n=1 Tax=Candidatus Fervidibacter sacchari TaxID=1448929 RepID=A0ABT2ER86_9BACT|nr:DEAD/DEAH box helicase [Candidatus Fervidibacter sacchari]MCS3920480.1 superfamily II RNA helicase [Candidatus Fervidibacter sacchari]WKU14566.1 DEAD/DEAH box helicase [Candidatus Fervidibacter sacchari]
MGRRSSHRFNPTISAPRLLAGRDVRQWVREFLEGMGEPEPQPFTPSDFQIAALNAVLEQDTIVVAPTGSGKTWIAEQAIAHFLAEGRRSWYTTPLKALSNQKYDAFRELFGDENVGLLTGERRENSQAPIIVATTEVLRNLLYTASGEIAADFIVLDEAHYLADPERGVTWEEVIILAPPESRFLLLSATIANADELAGWMREIRGQEPALIWVDSKERPVPLRYGFLDRFGRPLPLKVVDLLPQKALKRLIWHSINPVDLVHRLRERNLLPAIIFLPRRRDCDEAVRLFRKYRMEEGREEREAMFAQLAQQFPRLWEHPLARYLIEAGVAPHHAGHLTAWKIAVERMLRAGLVRAVFATTTLAAGLDVPARTVVLPTLRVRDEKGERNLTALEFHQMTGRAGRRGKDKVGFVLIIPRHPRDFERAKELAESEPEDLRSAFRVQYYQVLNLLATMGYEDALTVLDKSFAVYQMARRSHRRARTVRQELRTEFKRRASLLQELGYLDEDWHPTIIGEWGLLIRHERSLFIVEAVRQGLMDTLSPEELAGWAAAFTTERSPRYPVARVNLEPLWWLVYELEELEEKHKLEPSRFSDEFEGEHFSDANRRAAAVFRWAEGKWDWNMLVERSGSDEGDLQRLILQASEVLRQLEELPLPVASRAKLARLSLLRDPVTDVWRPTEGE